MIIALSGKKSSGKSFLAKKISDLYGFKILSFSTPLKKLLKEISCYNEDIKNSNDEITMCLDRFNLSPITATSRKCLQILGTDIIRKNDPNFFIREMNKKLIGDVVIDDLRFNNEYDLLKSKGAIVIRLNERIENNDNHDSELLDFPYDIIMNSGDIEKIKNLIKF